MAIGPSLHLESDWALAAALEMADADGIPIFEAITQFARNAEESDAAAINILFKMNRKPDRVQLISQGSTVLDKAGIDGYFVEGPKARPTRKSFDLKAKTSSSVAGRGLLEIVLAKDQSRINGLTRGYVYHRATDYIISRDGYHKYIIVPIDSIRMAVSKCGIALSPSPTQSELMSHFEMAEPLQPGETPEPGFPYKYSIGGDSICALYVPASELDGVEILEEPTSAKLAEYERAEADETARYREQMQREIEERIRKKKEETEQMQVSAHKEIDDILALDGMICPYDKVPLRWDPKKKAIRCSQKSHQKCGNPGANNAGKGGVQGSNLNKIQSGFHQMRDFEMEAMVQRAIKSYKKLVFTLDPKVMPSTMDQLKANLERVIGPVPDLDKCMRANTIRELHDLSAWDVYKAEHYANEPKGSKPSKAPKSSVRESLDLEYFYRIAFPQ